MLEGTNSGGFFAHTSSPGAANGTSAHTSSPGPANGTSMDADHASGISEGWHDIGTFESEEALKTYMDSHPQGFRAGKDSRAQNGCVLLASPTSTDLHCFALCRYRVYMCKRCCDSSDAKQDPVTGRKNYGSVFPKCGLFYRVGVYCKAGSGSATGRGRALSSSSVTGPQQNIYEYVGGEIVLQRRRARGSTGVHVCINPTEEMYGVNTAHFTPFDRLYPIR